MSRDLINPSSQTGVVAGLGDTGMDAGDIALPRIVLTQSLSQAVSDGKAPVGVYWNTLTETVVGGAFHFVPVLPFRNRVRLVVGQGLRCRSIDMVNGQGDPGILCDQCEYKDWPEDAAEGGPKCGVSHNWFGLIVAAPKWEGAAKAKTTTLTVEPLAEPEMGVVQWRSMATNTARRLRGLHVRASIVRPNSQWWDRTYLISAEQQTNAKGKFYVPTVKVHGPTTPDALQMAQRAMSAIMGTPMQWEPTGQEGEEEQARPETAAAAPVNPNF